MKPAFPGARSKSEQNRSTRIAGECSLQFTRIGNILSVYAGGVNSLPNPMRKYRLEDQCCDRMGRQRRSGCTSADPDLKVDRLVMEIQHDDGYVPVGIQESGRLEIVR